MANFKKTFFIELAIFLIVTGALVGGLLFFSTNISGSVAAIGDLRQKLVNNAASLNLFATLQSQYNGQAETDLSVLHNIVPTKDQLINLSKGFQALASQQSLGYGFSFAGETVPAGPGSFGSVAFKLNIQGSDLSKIFQFVQALENYQYLTALDSFDLSRQTSGYQMIIAGRVFYR